MNYSTPIATKAPIVMRVHKRRRKAKRGRLYIFLLFVWLRMIDTATLFFLYPRLATVYKQYLVVSIVTVAVWTTGLLLAIWFRQHWAKYLLVFTLLMAVISTLMMLPGLPDSMQPQKLVLLTMGITAVYLPVALVLIASRHIHKLTRGKQE